MSSPDTLVIARAIHDGLGPSWAYANYGGDEWHSMRGPLLSAAANVAGLYGPIVALLRILATRVLDDGDDWPRDTAKEALALIARLEAERAIP